jgi:hypothetical protein
VRTKKDRIPPGADARDKAWYAKLRDYMIRVDDAETCETCGKKVRHPVGALDGVHREGAAARPAAVAAGDEDEDSRSTGNRFGRAADDL